MLKTTEHVRFIRLQVDLINWLLSLEQFSIFLRDEKQCDALKTVFHLLSCERGPDPPLLSHSWRVLSCRYLALTAVEIFVLFLENAESSSDKQKISKKHTNIFAELSSEGVGAVGGGQAELRVSVNLDCQGMPGGASIAQLPFIKAKKRGENAAAALWKFSVFQSCV